MPSSRARLASLRKAEQATQDAIDREVDRVPQNVGSSPLGRILRQSSYLDGTSRIVLDNGVVNTITIACLSEQLPELLGQDMRAIRDHLMTRSQTHFRVKGQPK